MSQWNESPRWRLAWIAAIAACCGVVFAPAAQAAQQQNAYVYVHWNFKGAHIGQNVDQNVRIAKKSPKTFWAMSWTFGGSSQGGYLGLQTGGNRTANGSTGDTADFALWGADAASQGCAAFDGEGTGFRCAIPYSIHADRYYRYRVWKLDSDSAGQWWGAWILDQSTGMETFVGAIHVPTTDQYIIDVLNFSEYFGDAVSSPSRVPQSTAYYKQPAGDQTSANAYRYGSSYSYNTIGSGATARVDLIDLGNTTAAIVKMGGRMSSVTP